MRWELLSSVSVFSLALFCAGPEYSFGGPFASAKLHYGISARIAEVRTKLNTTNAKVEQIQYGYPGFANVQQFPNFPNFPNAAPMYRPNPYQNHPNPYQNYQNPGFPNFPNVR